MLYLLSSAIGTDVANCVVVTYSYLWLTDQTLTSSERSGSSDNTTARVEPTSSTLGSIAALTGASAILLALPQIIAARNLRQYQNELTTEQKHLQELVKRKLQEQGLQLAETQQLLDEEKQTTSGLKGEIQQQNLQLIKTKQLLEEKKQETAQLNAKLQEHGLQLAETQRLLDKEKLTSIELEKKLSTIQGQLSTIQQLLVEREKQIIPGLQDEAQQQNLQLYQPPPQQPSPATLAAGQWIERQNPIATASSSTNTKQ